MYIYIYKCSWHTKTTLKMQNHMDNYHALHAFFAGSSSWCLKRMPQKYKLLTKVFWLTYLQTDLFHCKLKALTYTELNFRDVEFIVCKEIALQVSGLTTMICCYGAKPEHNSIIHAQAQDSQHFLEVSSKPPGKAPKSLEILGQSRGWSEFLQIVLKFACNISKWRTGLLLCVVQSVIEPWFEPLILEMSHVHKTRIERVWTYQNWKDGANGVCMIYLTITPHPGRPWMGDHMHNIR